MIGKRFRLHAGRLTAAGFLDGSGELLGEYDSADEAGRSVPEHRRAEGWHIIDIGPAAMTPAELFTRAGSALFGDQYVAPLAVALKVEKNTVGKWAAGKSPVPAGVWRELEALTLQRYIALPEIRKALARAAEGKLEA